MHSFFAPGRREGFFLTKNPLLRRICFTQVTPTLWFRFRRGFGVKNPIQGNRLDCHRLLYEAEEEPATTL